MKIKILQIVPSVSYVSGISSVVMNYYRNIDKDKIQFDFMYINEAENNNKNEIKKLGGQCFRVENILNPIKFKKQINNFVKLHKNEYSIIHLHMPFLALFFYSLKKKLNAKAFVLHAHNIKFGNTPITHIRNLLAYKLFINKADCYFACSKIAGITLFGKRYIENGYMMFNIIDLSSVCDQVPKEEAKHNLSLDNKFVIGHVGVFHKPKNHLFIIDVFCEVVRRRPDARLLLVGDGALRSNVEEYAKEKNVFEYIVFAGAQTNVYKYYNAMDLFLFPSLFEGFGMALFEAQICNIPCVISDVNVDEVRINKDSIKALSLKKSAVEWAECIIGPHQSKESIENRTYINNIVNNSIESLQEKYLSLIND